MNNINSRYDKFKKNNLPTPFWDDERQTLEYVHFTPKPTNNFNEFEKQLEVNSSLTEALGKIVNQVFYYSFTAKDIRFCKENGKTVRKAIIGHMHAHSFEEVVKVLYNLPESFKVSKEEEEFYSQQELDYLKLVQKYLLLIGMKDIDINKIPMTRYRNNLHTKYENASIYRFNDQVIQDIINGKRSYLVGGWYPEYLNAKQYRPGEARALIADKDYNFKIFIEFTKSETKQYKDIKHICPRDLTDDDKVIVKYFKIVEIFK